MPVGDIFYLALVVIAFGVFAAALAWADSQTRGRPAPTKAETQPPADERKAA